MYSWFLLWPWIPHGRVTGYTVPMSIILSAWAPSPAVPNVHLPLIPHAYPHDFLVPNLLGALCQLLSDTHRFSDTCFLDTDGQATCDACAPGYTGRRCER